jgi:hypothetical protein
MRSVGFSAFWGKREKRGWNLRKSICGLYTGLASVGIAAQYFKTAIEREDTTALFRPIKVIFAIRDLQSYHFQFELVCLRAPTS